MINIDVKCIIFSKGLKVKKLSHMFKLELMIKAIYKVEIIILQCE